MKLKQYFFPLLILIATGLTAFFIYEMFHNFESDNIVSVTSNTSNVIVNQVTELSSRDNSNITSNITNSDNSTTVLPNDSKSLTQLGWAVGAFAFVLIAGLILPPVLEHYFGPAARQVGESIEMQTIPERVLNS